MRRPNPNDELLREARSRGVTPRQAAIDRLAAIRERQRGIGRDAARKAAATAFVSLLEEHQGCTWEQVGACVYCSDHDLRLYQGRLPERSV